jgi:hypothetical protein
MIRAALLETKQVHDLGNCVAGLPQFLKGHFHHALGWPAFDFFQKHMIVVARTHCSDCVLRFLGRAAG